MLSPIDDHCLDLLIHEKLQQSDTEMILFLLHLLAEIPLEKHALMYHFVTQWYSSHGKGKINP